MPKKMNPVDILNEAARLVAREGTDEAGDYRACHELIARLWAAYLPVCASREIGPRDVAHMLILVKLARATIGGSNPENGVDICGYAAIAGAL